MRWIAKRIAMEVLVAILLVGSLTPALGQEKTFEAPFTVRPNNYMFKWDPVQNVLIFHRDTTDPLMPTVRAYADGTRAGTPLLPLKDFPDAKGLDIWNVAATPEGGIILASVLQYGGINTKHMFLTYDMWGLLKKVWEVYPYHHHQLAVDGEGNAYAFGHREDRGEGADEPDYPLLIKYSPEGKVLWESLPRSQFSYDTEIVGTNSNTGEHALLFAGDVLLLYVATTRELLHFDRADGRLLERVSLAPFLEQIARKTGSARSEIRTLAVTSKGGLLAQMVLWPRDRRRAIMGFLMARISPDGSSWQQASAITPRPDPGTFLGLTREGKRIFISGSGSGSGETILHYR